METAIANICERWGMRVDLSEADDLWFANWIRKHPKEKSLSMTSGWHAYQSVLRYYKPSEIKSAMEYFGGIGAQSLMIQELFDPDWHMVVEYLPRAVEHLKRELPASVEVVLADAYDPKVTMPADIVALDFGDFTCWKTRTEPDQPVRHLLDRVFAKQPKAVLFTDIANARLHLHRQRYETLLGEGTCETYESYLYALVQRFRDLYGYHLADGFYHKSASKIMLVPIDAGPPGTLQPPPERPIGLELL